MPKQQLENLVNEIVKKQDRIIPIIGDDCFVGYIECDGQQVLVPLQSYISEELLGKSYSLEIKNKISSEGYHGLDILFEEYQSDRRHRHAGFAGYIDSIKEIINTGVETGKVFLREDVRDFLLAGQFEVVATTCPFPILEEVLKWRGEKYNISSFAPMASNGARAEATLKIPSIYKLFGDCEGEFVAGEDDLLKYLHYLNQTDAEKGFGASPLVKYIKDKGVDNAGYGLLMPIGCNNLPNWLFRFLWYPFSQEKSEGKEKNNVGGIWHKYSTDEQFLDFLYNYQFRTLSEPQETSDSISGDPVLLRLTEVFRNSRNSVQKYASDKLNVQWNQNDKWDYFISYAREDQEIAGRICDILTTQCCKKVWMDNRGGIRPGDEYWNAIQYGIEHSQKFIFVITNSYLNKATDKNHNYEGNIKPTGVYSEIEKIKHLFIEKKRDNKRGFAFPLIMHGTTVSYTDYNQNKHIEEPLKSGVLEMLPKFKEYEMLQTDILFEGIQDLICTEENLEENLVKLFKE